MESMYYLVHYFGSVSRSLRNGATNRYRLHIVTSCINNWWYPPTTYWL